MIQLLRNKFRYASRKYWDQIACGIRPVGPAATEAAVRKRCSTNAAEPPECPLRAGHSGPRALPTEQAAMKCLYMTTRR
jgi:putative transposase